MHEIILHHYDISPYAEKIRLTLGLKGLAWRSVQIPLVMPKPKLTALTGGYRLTPVMQIGADIYCDTRVIARALERLRPEPVLFPPGAAVLERAMSSWGETMFLVIVTLALGDGVLPQEFIDDRKKLLPGGLDMDLVRAAIPAKRDQLRAKLDLLDGHLADGRAYVLGDAISHADLAAYHPLWALATLPTAKSLLDPTRHVQAWMERVGAKGHGTCTDMDADEALAIAKDATPATREAADPGDPNGRRPGDRVMVMPEEYGRDPVAGELVACDAHEIAIRRRHPDLGDLVVHFPRETHLTLSGA